MSDALSTEAVGLPRPTGAHGRRRFAFLSVLAIAAVVALAAVSLVAIHRELTDSALQRRASVAELAASNLSEKFGRVVDLGVSLATRVRFRELIEAGEWGTAAEILHDAPADFGFVERIGLIDPQGALQAGVPPVPVPGRQNFSERPWFKAALTGKPALSPIYKRAAEPPLNVFVAAVPIRSSKGRLLGVLTVQIAVDKFFSWMGSIDVGADGLVYVVDPNGALAFHPTLPLQGQPVDFSSVPVVRAALEGKRGVEAQVNPIDREERVSAYAPVAGYGWGVVVAEPTASVFEARNTLFAGAVAAYLLILASSGAYVAARISRQRERERGLEDARRRAQDALARQSERLRILREIDRATVAEEDSHTIAEAAILPLRDLLGVPRAIVNLFDLPAGKVEWLAAAGRRRLHAGAPVRYSIELMGDVDALKRGEPQVVDTRALPPGPEVDALLASGVRVYMVVPMIAGGELIGALSFGGESAAFSVEQMNIAQETATQLAIAITQSRLLERVRRHAAELEQRVAERTAQLELANKELESFSYSVSHDLRAPLRAVDGYALMLAEDYGERLDDEGRRLLSVVRSSAEQMGRLIDDLLKFSQVGRRPLAKAPLDMRALASEVLGELAQAYPKARVELGALPAAPGDRALLRHVWTNLLGNALKYSARQDAPRVEIEGRTEGAEAVYTVRDNGAGFDMRYYAKLFNVFQRLHREDEFEGTGVGLAIVQRVVVRHGGRIWGEAAPGKGARFHFSLPMEG